MIKREIYVVKTEYVAISKRRHYIRHALTYKTNQKYKISSLYAKSLLTGFTEFRYLLGNQFSVAINNARQLFLASLLLQNYFRLVIERN